MLLSNLKQIVEKNFNPIFTFSILIGLFVPGLENISKHIPAYLIAIVIFLSVSKIDQNDLSHINLKEIIVFSLLRFILFPVCIFLVAESFLPEISNGMLLLCLVPAGVSTAALAGILGGSISLALSITVFSTFLAPFVIPLAFYFLTTNQVNIDTISMFYNLIFLIFVPIFLSKLIGRYFRRQNVIIRENASWISVVLISLVTIIILGKYQNEFFKDLFFSFELLFYLSLLYFSYYFFPWFICRNKGLKKNISYTLGSGANNSALAVVLGSLYLDPVNIIFLVLSEVVWTFSLVPFKKFIEIKKRVFSY